MAINPTVEQPGLIRGEVRDLDGRAMVVPRIAGSAGLQAGESLQRGEIRDADGRQVVTLSPSVAVPNVDYLLPGLLAPADAGFNGAFASQAVTAGRIYFLRTVAPRTINGVNMVFSVTVADTVDNPVYVGIYNAGLTTKLADSGPVSGKLNATGTMTVPLPYTLPGGAVYYFAILVPTITTSLNLNGFNVSNTGTIFYGSAPPNVLITAQNGAASLPTTPAAGAIGSGPALLLREN